MTERPTAEELGPREDFTKELSVSWNDDDIVVRAVVAWGGPHLGWGFREFSYTAKGAVPVSAMSDVAGYAVQMLRYYTDPLIAELEDIYK